jgi:hypothetical protein
MSITCAIHSIQQNAPFLNVKNMQLSVIAALLITITTNRADAGDTCVAVALRNSSPAEESKYVIHKGKFLDKITNYEIRTNGSRVFFRDGDCQGCLTGGGGRYPAKDFRLINCRIDTRAEPEEGDDGAYYAVVRR